MPVSLRMGPSSFLCWESSCPPLLALAVALQLIQCLLPGLVVLVSVTLGCDTITPSLLSLHKQTNKTSVVEITSVI